MEEVRRLGRNRNTTGRLFGMPIDGGFRIVAAHHHSANSEPEPAGLEALGIFASRVRGEVFLTESDLERLCHLPIALVVAGGRAGFFVREPDGSMLTILSYQEFPV